MEDPRAGHAAEQVRVLADPAESGIARECLLQHRRRIDEGAIAERTYLSRDAIGELLQAAAQNLVIVTSERIAGHVTQLWLVEDLPRIARVRRVVVHTHGDDPHRAGQKFVRAAALDAVPRHVIHRAVTFGSQPVQQMRFVLGQID